MDLYKLFIGITIGLLALIGLTFTVSVVLTRLNARGATLPGLKPATMMKLRDLSMGVFVFATVSVVCCLIAEFSLRWTERVGNPPGFTQKHPTRGYALQPDYRGYTHQASLAVNSRGVRGPERTADDKALRILVLGDSMTFGIGVEEHQAYPGLLQRKLGDADDQSRAVQVFNLGVPSYNTTDEAIYLEEVFEEYKPDLVLLQYMLENDAFHKPRPEKQTGIRATGIFQALREIPPSSYLFGWLYRKINQATSRRKVAQGPEDVDEQVRLHVERLRNRTYAEDAAGWIEVRASLKRIVDFLDKQQVPLLFTMNVNHIYLAKKHRLQFEPLIRYVSHHFLAAGVDEVHLIDEAFQAYAGREHVLFVTPDDAHWSVEGHEVLAEWLLPRVVDCLADHPNAEPPPI